MEDKLHKLVTWLCSQKVIHFLCKLGVAVLLTVSLLLLQYGCVYWTIGVFLLWIFCFYKDHSLTEEYKEINKKNESLQATNKILQERYNSLLRLTDSLFDAQMISLHNKIYKEGKPSIRTSVYMYDAEKANFRCFARYSKHTPFCKKNTKNEYPNKGWLQSTWNNQDYYFKCEDSNVTTWIAKCKEECKKNCYNADCHNTSCVSGRKERLSKHNCSMLSKSELQKKTMKAKSVYGHVLRQGSKSLGIILVESMEIWDDDTFEKVKQTVIQYSNASLEILSLHGKQLMELLNTTDTQKDMADSFVAGE